MHTLPLSLLALCLILAVIPAMAQEYTMYDNGPVNGQVNALLINFGVAVTDSLYNGDGTLYVSSFSFWVWLFPGDTLSSVEVSIGSTPYGTDLFHRIVNPSSSNCFTNGYGYYVCLESYEVYIANVNGTAWFTLQNATVPSGDPVYWDQNSGVGCKSQGCPSRALQKAVGYQLMLPATFVPSETFTIYGERIAAGSSTTGTP